jgi:hypothetical protein
MPAKSKSQQRLFGMVHAYNKGELHASRELRRRIAAISRRISDEDARHFAKTKHDDLPEKRAQVIARPETLQDFYARVPVGDYASMAIPASVRSERRRSFLGSVLYGAGGGAVLGGLGAAGLGAFIASHASKDSGLGQSETRRKMLEAAAKLGLWGAGRGAAAGATVGAGLGIWDKIRG